MSTQTTLELPCYVGGESVSSDDRLSVYNPYSGDVVGTVPMLSTDFVETAVKSATSETVRLTRYERYEILNRTRDLVSDRSDELARLICMEAGLCMRETRYEVGRAQDVLQFAAMEALRDDGQTFSCDVSPQGKARKIFTLREPLQLAVAITPFNHPLNQVAHKVAPAIAAGTPMILKPSEKTPLTAIRFVELLYEAGLPRTMLQVVLGSVDEFVRPLYQHPLAELVSFTGSAAIGKKIASDAGYKKLCLELGGNSPLIILDDADMDLAITLAAEGCFRNSGQRCTSVKRLLVHERILAEFTEQFVAKTAEYVCGDPASDETRVGTVIDADAAELLQRRVEDAVTMGARVLTGGKRDGALMPPTVIADVPRTSEMVVEESFGPLAPILSVSSLEDAISLANATAYGLSSGIVTSDMDAALTAVKGIRTGTVNVNQVPGYRVECSPFGGVKDSGLGIKEGVIEAIKFLTNVKTFSLPW